MMFVVVGFVLFSFMIFLFLIYNYDYALTAKINSSPSIIIISENGIKINTNAEFKTI